MVIQNILNNTSVIEKDVSNSSILELITYEECDKNCILSEKLDIINQLLPCELDVTPITKVAMMNLTTIVELSKGHNLHVNSKLSTQ